MLTYLSTLLLGFRLAETFTITKSGFGGKKFWGWLGFSSICQDSVHFESILESRTFWGFLGPFFGCDKFNWSIANSVSFNLHNILCEPNRSKPNYSINRKRKSTEWRKEIRDCFDQKTDYQWWYILHWTGKKLCILSIKSYALCW